MKILFLFIGLVLVSSASAQKLKTQITDSGDTLYSTPDEKIYTKGGAPRAVGEYLKTSVYKKGKSGSPILELEIQTGRTSIFTIGAGSAADITLHDGTVVSVYSRLNSESKRSSLDYGCFIFAFYTLTAKDIRLLKASPVKSIRVNASVGPMDYNIKEKFGDAIAKQISRINNTE